MHSLQEMHCRCWPKNCAVKFKKKAGGGLGGRALRPPPQRTRCKECIADVDLEVLCFVVVVVVVVVAVVVVVVVDVVACQVLIVVDVGAGGCGGGAGAC